MQAFRIKLNKDGRIVIPAYCRQQLHLKPGEELVIRLDKDELRLASIKQRLRKLQQIIKQRTKGKSLVAELKNSRYADDSLRSSLSIS